MNTLTTFRALKLLHYLTEQYLEMVKSSKAYSHLKSQPEIRVKTRALDKWPQSVPTIHQQRFCKLVLNPRVFHNRVRSWTTSGEPWASRSSSWLPSPAECSLQSHKQDMELTATVSNNCSHWKTCCYHESSTMFVSAIVSDYDRVQLWNL